MAVVAYALTTLNKVKTYLFNSTSGTTYDDLLEMLIDEMTVFVEMECGERRFKNSGVDISNELHNGDFDGSGRNKIFIKQWPIVSITSIEYKAGTNSDPNWTALTEDDYTRDDSTGIIYINGGLAKGRQNYRVTYKGGFTVIPLDLEMCCTKLVAKEFDKRRSQGVTNEGIGGGNVAWNENIDPSALRILNKYRRFN